MGYVLLKQFQFQFGAIGRVNDRVLSRIATSFNSSLVRLGGIPKRHFVSYKFCFNSSLVRLGGNLKIMWSIHTLVSIPVLCDWEAICILFLISCIEFQFQFGAIGSVFRRFKTFFYFCFNSSLVRLGDQ